MKKAALLATISVSLLGAACGIPLDRAKGEEEDAGEAAEALLEPNERRDVDGPTDEARSAVTAAQAACVVGCAAAAGAGCAAVATACTAGAIWTFGGIGVPCSYVVIAACGAVEGAAAACTLGCTR
jgi:hypothetical protein